MRDNPWGNPKTEEGWVSVGYVSDVMIEDGYRKCIANAGGNTQILTALELERKGGPCPVCGRDYRKIEVDNKYGKFTFYQPSCMCFKQCGSCGRFLVSERLLDIWHCTSCHPEGLEKKKKKQHKASYTASGGDE
jgi:hypothetical protein